MAYAKKKTDLKEAMRYGGASGGSGDPPEDDNNGDKELYGHVSIRRIGIKKISMSVYTKTGSQKNSLKNSKLFIFY